MLRLPCVFDAFCLPCASQLDGGASNVDFDGRRFSAMGRDARWASTDGDDPDQYEIEISGGARTLSVTTA